MSVRQQRRAIAEARARRGEGGGSDSAVGQGSNAAAEISEVPASNALRTPAAQIGLQVMRLHSAAARCAASLGRRKCGWTRCTGRASMTLPRRVATKSR